MSRNETSLKSPWQPRKKRWLTGYHVPLLAVIGMGLFAGYHLDLERIALMVPEIREPAKPIVVRPPQSSTGIQNLESRSMPICGGGKRVNCVVDGDTIWVDGEKIRLDSMNAPEVNGSCRRERDLAAKATRRLSQILSSQTFTISRKGKDWYGRTLATVRTGNGDVGMVLVREGLAHVWRGRKENWCA